MADKSLVASIRIDADASGVAKGVASANKELQKLQAARQTAINTGISAGLMAAREAYQLVRQAIDMVDARAGALGDKALAWSPAAIAAQAAGQGTVMAADMQIGQALGPGQAAVEQIKAQAASREAARVTRDAPSIAAGMAVWQSLKSDAGAAWDGASDSMLKALGGDYSENPTQAMFNASGATEYYQQMFSSMVDYLKAISQKIGGS